MVSDLKVEHKDFNDKSTEKHCLEVHVVCLF